MSQTDRKHEPLSRQACEPCRRNKTKCSGEKPNCAFCTRLKVHCFYLPRGSPPANGVGSRSGTSATGSISKNRFEQLESHIHELYSLLGPSPPIEALEHFVEVYRTKLHLQPLPLFNLPNLAERLLAGPQYLLWTFLALSLTLSSHAFYRDRETEARDLYSRFSEQAVMNMAWDGRSTPEIIQALCLVALRQIHARQPFRAWMTIGAGTRLSSLMNHSQMVSSSILEDDSGSRAFWSLYVLERLFLPPNVELSVFELPEYPESPPLPPPIEGAIPGYVPDSTTPSAQETSSLAGQGIGPPFYRLVSIWGKVRCYLHRLRTGEIEKPWLPSSTHTKLSVELIEHESRVCRDHLLSNAKFSERSAAELAHCSEYWNLWISGEILWHATYAILNHPFIHLVILRGNDGIPQSSGFPQQKSDLALYHASWVFRLIQLTEGVMEITNPLIGDAVAATATALWPFQFIMNTKIAQGASTDLIRCDTFLSNMSLTWPHMSNKLGALRNLQHLAERNRQKAPNCESSIDFQPALFWSLLDPRIDEAVLDTSPATELGPQSGQVAQSRMYLKTHFVQPLWENQGSGQQQEDGPFPAPNAAESLLTDTHDMEQFNIEELSPYFLQSGLWSLPHDSIEEVAPQAF